jgi:hypothetical protein
MTMAALAGGCRPAPTQDVAELGRLGARITVAPERADEILHEAGVAPAEFAAAVRDLASRPAAARRYREAFAAESEALAPAPRPRPAGRGRRS